MTKKKPEWADEEGPVYTVSMDAGVFSWLEEQLQAKLKYQYNESYKALVRRALVSFDDAKRGISPNGDAPSPEHVPARKRRIPDRRGSKRRK